MQAQHWVADELSSAKLDRPGTRDIPASMVLAMLESESIQSV